MAIIICTLRPQTFQVLLKTGNICKCVMYLGIRSAFAQEQIVIRESLRPLPAARSAPSVGDAQPQHMRLDQASACGRVAEDGADGKREPLHLSAALMWRFFVVAPLGHPPIHHTLHLL